MARVNVDAHYCKGCLRCVDVCKKECLGPSGLSNASGYDYVEVKEGKECVACGLCYMVCPDVAITIYK